MLHIIKNKLSLMEKKTKSIMNYGIFFSFGVSIISVLILVMYIFFPAPIMYEVGISVFKLSLFFAIEFIICAIAIDTIKHQI